MSTTSSRIEDIYPLTALQGLLLVDARTAADGRADILSFTLRGPIHPAHIKRAWRLVHDRHPSMRAAFVWEKVPQPMQMVRRDAVPWVKIADIDLAPAELLEANDWPLSTAPQIRLAIVPTGRDEHRLVVGYRPSMFDGWSVALVMREFLSAIDNLTKGRQPSLPPCHPFRDYVAWLKSQDIDEADQFWRDALAGIDLTTPIRAHRPAADAQSAAETTVKPMGAERAVALKAFAQALRTTPNMVLQALWAILLRAYGAKDDVVFGAATSGRPTDVPNVDSMVGVFFNNIPIRVRMDGGQTVGALLKQLQSGMQAANRYGYTSPARVRELWDADVSQPLFQSILLFHNFPLKGTFWETDRAFSIDTIEKPIVTNIPLSVVCVPEMDFELRLIASSNIADQSIRQAYLDDLCTLIDRVTHSSEQAVDTLCSMITAPDVPLQRPDRDAVRDLSDREDYVAPITDREQYLVSVIADVAGVKNIGIHHNFFEIGIRSIQLVRIAARLSAAGLGNLTAVDFFEFPTVASLSARQEAGSSSTEEAKPSRDVDSARAARQRRVARRGAPK